MCEPLSVDALVLPYAIRKPLSISFKNQSEIIGIVGQNGAGKTSLLRGIAGLLPAVSGEVRVEGRSILNLNRRSIAQKIAYVPQIIELLGELVVEEVVSFGRFAHQPKGLGQLRWRRTEADERAIDAALSVMQLEALRNRAVQTLSGGERQRVAVARGLAQETPVLLLDEPCAHLDLGHAISLLQHLSQAKNRLVLVAMHDLNLAAMFCNRLILLNFGELVAQGTPQEIIAPEVLGPIYGEALAFLSHPLDGVPQVLPRRSCL